MHAARIARQRRATAGVNLQFLDAAHIYSRPAPARVLIASTREHFDSASGHCGSLERRAGGAAAPCALGVFPAFAGAAVRRQGPRTVDRQPDDGRPGDHVIGASISRISISRIASARRDIRTEPRGRRSSHLRRQHGTRGTHPRAALVAHPGARERGTAAARSAGTQRGGTPGGPSRPGVLGLAAARTGLGRHPPAVRPRRDQERRRSLPGGLPGHRPMPVPASTETSRRHFALRFRAKTSRAPPSFHRRHDPGRPPEPQSPLLWFSPRPCAPRRST